MEKKPETKTTNEFVNVDDIRNGLLYTNYGYMFGYLRVYPANLELKTREELSALTERLSANVKGDNLKFAYFSLPREVDIDRQKAFLEKKYMEELASQKRKQIIGVMIQHAVELSSSHENYEHHHFIKLWCQVQGRESYLEEQELKNRLQDWKQYYSEVKIHTEILDDTEILRLCNLFSNGVQAVHEQISDIHYTPHTVLK